MVREGGGGACVTDGDEQAQETQDAARETAALLARSSERYREAGRLLRAANLEFNGATAMAVQAGLAPQAALLSEGIAGAWLRSAEKVELTADVAAMCGRARLKDAGLPTDPTPGAVRDPWSPRLRDVIDTLASEFGKATAQVPTWVQVPPVAAVALTAEWSADKDWRGMQAPLPSSSPYVTFVPTSVGILAIRTGDKWAIGA